MLPGRTSPRRPRHHDGGYWAERAYPRRLIVPHTFRLYLEEPGVRTIRRVLADEAAGRQLTPCRPARASPTGELDRVVSELVQLAEGGPLQD